MLADDNIMPINSSFTSPVVLCWNNNGKNFDDPEDWRFVIDDLKLNVIIQYPQFRIPVTDEILANTYNKY